MHVKSIELYDFPELGRGNRVRIECNERVNLLVGPNATGKSTILRGLFDWVAPDLGEDDDEVPTEYVGSNSEDDDQRTEEQSEVSFTASADWPKDDEGEPLPAPSVGLPVMNISSIRLSYTDYRDLSNSQQAIRGPFDVGMHLAIGDKYYSGADLLTRERIPSVSLDEYRNFVVKCFKDVCPEVLHHVSIWVPYEQRGTTTNTFLLSYAENSTSSSDEASEEIPIYQTSSGTQSTLQWIQILVLMMGVSYRWQQGWENQSAILLVDEIENHLHPTWQRRVIPALLEHFPGLQIFAATHSPFVVAGLKSGQVHQFRRHVDGAISVTTNAEDIIGWTSDEISQRLLDIRTPTDLTIIAWSDRLVELRRKATLTSDEQSELDDLRRRVNLALLSGMNDTEGDEVETDGSFRNRRSDLSQDGA